MSSKRHTYRAGMKPPGSGNDFSESGLHDLPPETVDYLKHGAAEGSRNEALSKAAMQCRDSGRLGPKWTDLLHARASQDGLGNREIEATLRSCMDPSDAREGCGRMHGGDASNRMPMGQKGRSYDVKPRELARRQAQEPPVKVEANPEAASELELYPEELQGHAGFTRWLKELYEPGENIAFCAPDKDHENGGLIFTSGALQPREFWLEKADSKQNADRGKFGINGVLSSCDGVFFRINPMVEGKDSKSDRDVSAYRYVLVEFDDHEAAGNPDRKKEHLQALQDSRLPIASVTDSAGKGLHALVRVDAADRKEWNERRDLAYEALGDLYGLDKKACNPSRYSRCPTGRRGETTQKLVRLNIGAETWEQWETGEPTEEEWLESHASAATLAKASIDDSQTLLGDRFLCRGGVMMFTGTTGIGKSSAAMQQDILWCLGRAAFGIYPNGPMKIAVLQTENDEGDLIEMCRGVMDGLELTDSERETVDQNLRIYTVNKCGYSVLDRCEAIAAGRGDWKPDLIRLDPFQAILGLDVVGNIEAVLAVANRITQIGRKHGCAFMNNHHTPKINAATLSERGLEYSSYVGAGGAQLANWTRCDILLTPVPDKPGFFQMIAGKRAGRLGWGSKIRFFKHATDGIYWEDPTPEELAELQVDHGQGAKYSRKKGKSGPSKAEKEREENAALFEKQAFSWFEENGVVEDSKAEGFLTAPAAIAWDIPGWKNRNKVSDQLKELRAKYEAENYAGSDRPF